MPELPEVETVCNGLKEIIPDNKLQVKSLSFYRDDIRKPMPKKHLRLLQGALITTIKRRAKYIILQTPKGSLLNHLGMTGRWVQADKKSDKHDHFCLELSDGTKLFYRDPRRFGVIDYIAPGDEKNCKWLVHLGPEPLEKKSFTGSYLKGKCRSRKTTIKSLIMDQKVVVGVGNIYASEALFLAKIRPTRPANKVTAEQCDKLVTTIQKILTSAIRAGGSTIKDFAQAGGESGYFQRQLKVYGRDKELCLVCYNPIKSKVIAGRTTFWCPSCQK